MVLIAIAAGIWLSVGSSSPIRPSVESSAPARGMSPFDHGLPAKLPTTVTAPPTTTTHPPTTTSPQAPPTTVPPPTPVTPPSVHTSPTTAPALVAPKLPPNPSIKVMYNQLVEDGQPIQLRGVDAYGSEEACVRGEGMALGPSDAVEAAEIASWGANVVRVPLNEDCWLGINGVEPVYSGANYQTFVENWVSDLNKFGLVVILDLHLTAPGSYESTQQWPMADADHSETFWSQVATVFRSNASVAFDLFNEPFLGGTHPYSSDWACWLNGCTTTYRCSACSTPVSYRTAGMQQLVNAVRNTGDSQPILIGGLNYAGDPCGSSDSDVVSGGKCTWLTYEPVDPLQQLVASFHVYPWLACSSLSCWNQYVAPLAKTAPVIAGEFGEGDCATTFIGEFMQWADDDSVSYLAWNWSPSKSGVADSCVVASNGNAANTNLELLSDWAGDPSGVAPEGGFIRSHFDVSASRTWNSTEQGLVPKCCGVTDLKSKLSSTFALPRPVCGWRKYPVSSTTESSAPATSMHFQMGSAYSGPFTSSGNAARGVPRAWRRLRDSKMSISGPRCPL
jgi:endoglucanase